MKFAVESYNSGHLSVVNTYKICHLDFDVEGALQGNTQALTTQTKSIALLQQQEADNGTPVTVSSALPVLSTGLVTGQGGGLNVLQIATANGVNISRVNVMAMDYGPGFAQPGNPGMGTYAIDAATATLGQLMTLYPSLSSERAWSMLGVTPLVGINDDPREIFTLAGAQQLTTFAVRNHIGELSMWERPREHHRHLGRSRRRRRQRSGANPVRVLQDLRADRDRFHTVTPVAERAAPTTSETP
ncbi:hypothetical protein A4G26_04635 [Mycobacterium kansasii]|uniref:hypothetical protein n=1 Tax=Mycobacterium innocens TaxID=2341083 RepID=UPI0007BE706C|nr:MULTISPECIES: hypothetical protein [Mycobacterium]KZS76716.1 hypothetical protein A4G26_04635 [Mycobacterium kansasii]